MDLSIKTETSGFVSPSEIYVDKRLDLNELIIRDINTTFFFRYMGNDIDLVKKGNILVIDRSIKISENDLIIVYLNDNFRLEKFLNQENIFGKVTWVLNEL